MYKSLTYLALRLINHTDQQAVARTGCRDIFHCGQHWMYVKIFCNKSQCCWNLLYGCSTNRILANRPITAKCSDVHLNKFENRCL